jgi:hypothetical protein
MSVWKRIALEKLPECKNAIELAPDPQSLWIDIVDRFREAHREPCDLDLIRRTYELDWELIQSNSQDASSGTAIGFYHELPDDKLVAELAPRFLSRDQVAGLESLIRCWCRDRGRADQFLERFGIHSAT